MHGFDLKGKAALVTGGNGGIGLGMAKGLAQAGADLAIVGRDEAKNASALRELKEIGITAIAVKADLKAAVRMETGSDFTLICATASTVTATPCWV